MFQNDTIVGSAPHDIDFGRFLQSIEVGAVYLLFIFTRRVRGQEDPAMTIKALLITASCTAAFIGSPALAATTIPTTPPLPPPSYEVRLGGATTTHDTPGTYQSTKGSVSTQADPMPTLKTQAAVGNDSEDASAYMRYYYRVNGPLNEFVPVSLSGSIHLVATAGSTAQANSLGQVDLESVFTTDTANIEIDRGGTVRGGIADLTFNLHGTVYTNGTNSITLRAGSGVRGSPQDSASGSSYVDPILSIDPSFFTGRDAHDPSLYSLSFSKGIVNGLTGAVPEPATWAMLILGFGVIGSAMRRRRAARTTVRFA